MTIYSHLRPNNTIKVKSIILFLEIKIELILIFDLKVWIHQDSLSYLNVFVANSKSSKEILISSLISASLISPNRYTLWHNRNGQVVSVTRFEVTYAMKTTKISLWYSKCVIVFPSTRATHSLMPVFQETYVNERKAGLYSWYSTTSPKDRVRVPFLPWRVKGSSREHWLFIQACSLHVRIRV